MARLVEHWSSNRKVAILGLIPGVVAHSCVLEKDTNNWHKTTYNLTVFQIKIHFLYLAIFIKQKQVV